MRVPRVDQGTVLISPHVYLRANPALYLIPRHGNSHMQKSDFFISKDTVQRSKRALKIVCAFNASWTWAVIMVSAKIDAVEIDVAEGTTILQTALQAGIFIPHICFHSDLPPVGTLKPADAIYRSGERIENARPDMCYEGCGLCVVEIEGEGGLHRSCRHPIREGMVVRTVSPAIEAFRRDRIMELLSRHPHVCLQCDLKEGCARFPCSLNILELERCCPRFGNCEFQHIVEYVGIKPETPRYVFEELPIIADNPFFTRDYNLCINCLRCIQVCRQTFGNGALDFIYDGQGRIIVGTVKATLEESSCRFCLECVERCPTGVLMGKESRRHYRPLPHKPAIAPSQEQLIEYTSANLARVPGESGVYQLLDRRKAVIYIKGTLNLRKELEHQLQTNEQVCYFVYELSPLYSIRETEILQQYLSLHGEMPEGNRELEDRF